MIEGCCRFRDPFTPSDALGIFLDHVLLSSPDPSKPKDDGEAACFRRSHGTAGDFKCYDAMTDGYKLKARGIGARPKAIPSSTTHVYLRDAAPPFVNPSKEY